MPDTETTILKLRSRVSAFVEARGWESFHNPKDLATAITIEATDLMELFLWKDRQEVYEFLERSEARNRVEEELADVVILCLSLANSLQIDVADAVMSKVATNETKYPVELVWGKAHKYSYYAQDQSEENI